MGPRIACLCVAAAALIIAAAASPSGNVPWAISDIPGIQLTPLTELPDAPGNGSLNAFCSNYRIEPVSEAGRLVAGKRWIVTSEARTGQYQVVSFASGFVPGTSGVCFARNGNIGIFHHGSLVALAYVVHSSKLTLGRVQPWENGALLLWGGNGPAPPVGELRQEPGGFSLRRLPEELTFCRGQAVVPNIWGKPINEARTVLAAQRWSPKRPAEVPAAGDGAAELARHGLIEAQSCSGTGYGYCNFNYSGPGGTLGVTTIGGDWQDGSKDVVVDLGVHCP